MSTVKLGKLEFDAPTWDGKIVLAAIFIIGYFLLVLRLTDRSLPAENVELVKDALLVLGPPIGLIFHALFRTTAAEERVEARSTDTLKTAIETPGAPVPVPVPTAPGAPGSPEQMGEQVRRGAEEGARDGITHGLQDIPPDERKLSGIQNSEPEILR